MINNVRLKKFLKCTIFKCLSFVNNFIPKKDDVILLYTANEGIRHNLKPLRDKLISDGYNKKYKIICAVEGNRYYENLYEPNVFFTTQFRAIFSFFTTRHVFYTTGQLPIKPSKSQIVIHMLHGASVLKSIGSLSKINNGDEHYFTYILAPSEIYKPIFSRAYNCTENSVLVCGETTTDCFYNNDKLYNLGDFEKVILWIPTFRQSDYLNYDDSSCELLPMFASSDYEELNNLMKKYNYKLLVKLHPCQNTEDLSQKAFSNLHIYSDKDFSEAGYELYPLMKQVDALIGDYSTVSLQFLLLDKPISFVVPDIEEYSQRRGFCFDDIESYMAGPIIKTKQELYKFTDDLFNNVDLYCENREIVRNKIFKYQDGDNTERIFKISELYL